MPERSTGPMMLIGERCAAEECHREDFLPFKCPDCRQSFCGSHFRPVSHHCPKYEPTVNDYRVPLCPLCDTPPQGWKRDEDPNIAMERHLSSGQCPMLDSKGLVKTVPLARVKKPNECAYRKCTKVMVVPIQCPQCRSSFCPSHRAPAQHSCSSSPASSSSNLTSSKTKLSLTKISNGSSHPTNPTSSSNVSPFKKISDSVSKSSISNFTKPLSKPSSTASPDSKASSKPLTSTTTTTTSLINKATHNKLFDKTEKRARAERASAVKAMQVRQKKGLLTESEQLKLAQAMAEMANIKDDKKEQENCIIC